MEGLLTCRKSSWFVRIMIGESNGNFPEVLRTYMTCEMQVKILFTMREAIAGVEAPMPALIDCWQSEPECFLHDLAPSPLSVHPILHQTLVLQ